MWIDPGGEGQAQAWYGICSLVGEGCDEFVTACFIIDTYRLPKGRADSEAKRSPWPMSNKNTLPSDARILSPVERNRY
jgi:hypothetical protein